VTSHRESEQIPRCSMKLAALTALSVLPCAQCFAPVPYQYTSSVLKAQQEPPESYKNHPQARAVTAASYRGPPSNDSSMRPWDQWSLAQPWEINHPCATTQGIQEGNAPLDRSRLQRWRPEAPRTPVASTPRPATESGALPINLNPPSQPLVPRQAVPYVAARQQAAARASALSQPSQTAPEPASLPTTSRPPPVATLPPLEPSLDSGSLPMAAPKAPRSNMFQSVAKRFQKVAEPQTGAQPILLDPPYNPRVDAPQNPLPVTTPEPQSGQPAAVSQETPRDPLPPVLEAPPSLPVLPRDDPPTPESQSRQPAALSQEPKMTAQASTQQMSGQPITANEVPMQAIYRDPYGPEPNYVQPEMRTNQPNEAPMQVMTRDPYLPEPVWAAPPNHQVTSEANRPTITPTMPQQMGTTNNRPPPNSNTRPSLIPNEMAMQTMTREAYGVSRRLQTASQLQQIPPLAQTQPLVPNELAMQIPNRTPYGPERQTLRYETSRPTITPAMPQHQGPAKNDVVAPETPKEQALKTSVSLFVDNSYFQAAARPALPMNR